MRPQVMPAARDLSGSGAEKQRVHRFGAQRLETTPMGVTPIASIVGQGGNMSALALRCSGGVMTLEKAAPLAGFGTPPASTAP